MMAVPRYEYLDRRALALVRFFDAVGAPVLSPVRVSAAGAVLLHKRDGEMVVLEAPGLAAHTAAFLQPPASPALQSVALPLDIRPVDAGLGARRFVLRLPRDANPAAAAATSLFQPVRVDLLPTPSARTTGLLAALVVTVRRSDDQRRVEGALVRLRPQDGRPQARALTDAAGDALLLIPGVPLSSPGPGATVLPDISGALDAIVDPALARFNAEADLDAARAAPARFLDPDDLETRLGGSAAAAATVRIASGVTRTATIVWTPPP